MIFTLMMSSVTAVARSEKESNLRTWSSNHYINGRGNVDHLPNTTVGDMEDTQCYTGTMYSVHVSMHHT